MTTIDHQHAEPSLKEIPLNWRTIPRMPALILICLYQKLISPALPSGTCRFHPSCSHYSYQAIAKYGLIKGGALSVWRVLRCQPLSPGGFDPVP
jgi:hypothetical protein